MVSLNTYLYSSPSNFEILLEQARSASHPFLECMLHHLFPEVVSIPEVRIREMISGNHSYKTVATLSWVQDEFPDEFKDRLNWLKRLDFQTQEWLSQQTEVLSIFLGAMDLGETDLAERLVKALPTENPDQTIFRDSLKDFLHESLPAPSLIPTRIPLVLFLHLKNNPNYHESAEGRLGFNLLRKQTPPNPINSPGRAALQIWVTDQFVLGLPPGTAEWTNQLTPFCERRVRNQLTFGLLLLLGLIAGLNYLVFGHYLSQNPNIAERWQELWLLWGRTVGPISLVLGLLFQLIRKSGKPFFPVLQEKLLQWQLRRWRRKLKIPEPDPIRQKREK